MRMSKLISRTLREAPGGTQTAGHELLLRAGYIRQQAAGIFTAMPLAFRSLRKIEDIIRDEICAIGGQEMSMPVVNAADIWKETGRFYQIDKELSRFQDRNERDMVLAMTHEEAVTDVMRNEIFSYRQLPSLVFHIQTKWRDDPRPRAGLIRVREFVMKDSYSFDRDQAGLEQQYQAHYEAYFRIFKRCGLPTVVVGADSGMMGGKISHEYMYLSPIGEDSIIFCDSCEYIANRQVAVFQKTVKKEAELPLTEIETPNATTIESLCQFLGIQQSQTAKAVFMTGTFPLSNEEFEDKLIVAIIRGDLDVEEAKLQKAAAAIHIKPATEEEIRSCGIEPGYGSPIGQKGAIVIIDDSVANSSNLLAGANKPGYHYQNTNFQRDYDGTVADIAMAAEGASCVHCDGTLKLSRGVEVGNIFQLGTRYSETMGCRFQDEDGKEKPVIMGSYGIGVGRLLACVAEEYNDEHGLKLPISVAPYAVHLVSLMKEGNEAEDLYKALCDAGIEVLYDDRKDSPGVKFKDADLIGIPVRLTIGNRSLQEGGVEIVDRETGEKKLVGLEALVDAVKGLLEIKKSALKI